MRVAVVGGGLTGLAAAYELGKNHEVMLFEREPELGGVLASHTRPGYKIEKFYHHFFANDSELERLLREFGLWEKVVFKSSSVGQLHCGKIYKMNTPLEIARSFLSPVETLRLGITTLKARFLENAEGLDEVGAIEWAKANCGSAAYEKFFAPMLRSKFGDNANKVSAAWLVSRIKIRSNRSPTGEKVGYIRGGFWQLVSALEAAIKRNGGKTFRTAGVEGVVFSGDRVIGIKVGGKTVKCDAVIGTSPAFFTQQWAAGGIADAFSLVEYQCAVCVLVGLKKGVLDGVYWLNVSGDAPFGAVVEHTNYMPLEDYGGEHLVYLASYTQDASDWAAKASEAEVIEAYVSALLKMFPHLGREDVAWAKVFRDKLAGPVYSKGFIKKMPGYKTAVPGIYAAGMFSRPNYPERSMNGSLKAGFECAKEVEKLEKK